MLSTERSPLPPSGFAYGAPVAFGLAVNDESEELFMSAAAVDVWASCSAVQVASCESAATIPSVAPTSSRK